MKRFWQRILQEIMKKNNTWNIRCLVDESFVPATQRIILKIVWFQIQVMENYILGNVINTTFGKTLVFYLGTIHLRSFTRFFTTLPLPSEFTGNFKNILTPLCTNRWFNAVMLLVCTYYVYIMPDPRRNTFTWPTYSARRFWNLGKLLKC